MTAIAVLLLTSFVGTAPRLAAAVRVSVFGLFAPTELRVRPAGAAILRLSGESGEARLEGGQSAACFAAGARVVCRVGARRPEGASVEVDAAGRSPEFLLSVPGKIERRFQGRLLLTSSGSALRAVVLMDQETAIATIVAAESPPGAGFEALKAQAVAARSYLLAGPRHQGFDFCDTTHCQYLRDPLRESHPGSLAAAATKELVLTHEGKILRALYSRSCGGMTRSLREAGLAAQGYPYYGVSCEACRRAPERWRTTLDRSVIEPVLDRPTEALRIKLVRQAGWRSLPSTQFRSESTGDSVTLQGTGIGHGIGLCQRGAASMAAEGFEFSAILRHYFPNTRLGTAAGRVH